jgi:hypothetical protein
MLTFIITGYGLIVAYQTRNDIIGQTLVDSEFPPPSMSPLYMKPATWLMISVITAVYSLVQMSKERFRLLGSTARSVVLFLLFLTALVSFYEVMYNFMLWGSLMAAHDSSSQFNPDTIINSFPTDEYKINLVFATKMFVTCLGCSLYGFVVFRGIDMSK